MKKPIKIVLALVLVAAGWYCYKHFSASGAEGEATPAAKVETTPLQRQAIAETLNVFGVIGSAPSAEATSSAPYDCVIRKINVGVGAPVAAGDVLMEIDPSPDTKLQLDSA